MIYGDNLTPIGLAARLAEYISDPSTIRVRVKEHFGRAPTVEQCRKLRQAFENRPQKHVSYADYKYRTNCRRHDGPYEMDEDGFERCATCKEEKRRAELQRELDHIRRLQELRRQKEAARIKLANQQISKALAKLKDRPLDECDVIIQQVCAVFGITRNELLGKSHKLHFVDARTVVVVALRKRGHSYPWIAKRLGGRDHSTIINLFKTQDTRLKRNPLVGRMIETIG